MDHVCNWEHNTLLNELTQGMELARQLKAHLSSSSSSETREFLLQRILSSYEKALLIVKWSRSVESSISMDGSPRSTDFDRGFKDHQEHNDVSKKRKVLPTWTDQVRVCSENGLEGPSDDSYSWRKYGQKDILGAKYPRSYYRCTYRHIRGCWATKQVQRSDEDLTIFEITYRGRHTCDQSAPSVAPPETQERERSNHHNHHQQQQSNESLLNLRANLRVNTEDLDYQEMTSLFSFPSASFGCETSENQLCAFSPRVSGNSLGTSFISPATSESNYFSGSLCHMKSFGQFHNLQHSESNLTETISANTSATNSPIVDLDFPLDPVDFDFPFSTPGFFT